MAFFVKIAYKSYIKLPEVANSFYICQASYHNRSGGDMKLNFVKMEGLGNDFIFIDMLTEKPPIPLTESELAIRLCDRHFGIGADGIILVLPSASGDFGFRIINSDGSEAQMCGNGMRCFAKFLYEKGYTTKTEFTVETQAGTIIPRLILTPDKSVEAVRVDMGKPILDTKTIPFISDNDQAISENLATESGPVKITTVSMGNPHAVLFVEDAENAPVTTLGPKIECHPRFPEKTNVEFIEVISETELRMKVWERGAGVTLACGTGACAAAVAAILNEKTGRSVRIHLDGGALDIEWDQETGHLFKTGPATLVFEGTVELP